MRITLLVCALAVVACKKEKSTESNPSVAPKNPTSTKEQDALWALAPENAIAGMVITPTGLARMEAGWVEVTKFFDQSPELAPIKAMLDDGLSEVFGSATPSLAAAGLTSQKGLAAFLVKDQKAPMVIMPVGDRDKFLQIAKGEKGAHGIDTIKRDKCKTVKNVYACARDLATLDTLGKGNLSAALKLAGARGDIEVAADAPEPKLTVGGVVQLARGSVTARAGFKDLPPDILKFLGNQKPRTNGDKTAGFGMLNIGPFLPMIGKNAPPTPIVDGVSLTDIMKTVKGPITLTIDNGDPMFDVRLPLSDGGPLKKVVEQCDKLGFGDEMKVSVKDGVCQMPIPQMNMLIDAWVDGTTLRIGQKGAQSTAVASPLSPIGKELAGGEWDFVVFGRGTVLGPVAWSMPMPISSMPPQAKMMLRAMTVVNEIGIGTRLDGDVGHMLISVRTVFANPDDVVAKIVAISPDNMFTKDGAGKAIAAAHPKSQFATDFVAGFSGMMAPAGMVGIMAGIAIPAFMDYMKKPKQTEASLQLNKLGKNLKVIYIEKGEFPMGSVGPTPAKSCCAFDRMKCFEPAAWQDPLWQQLDFMIDEPHLMRYSYESKDGKSFVAKAHADLDCDGQETEWVLTGKIDNGGPVVDLVAPPPGEY